MFGGSKASRASDIVDYLPFPGDPDYHGRDLVSEIYGEPRKNIVSSFEPDIRDYVSQRLTDRDVVERGLTKKEREYETETIVTSIHIDSRQRDSSRYPKAEDFTYYPAKTFSNVTKITAKSLEIPNTTSIVRQNFSDVYPFQLEKDIVFPIIYLVFTAGTPDYVDIYLRDTRSSSAPSTADLQRILGMYVNDIIRVHCVKGNTGMSGSFKIISLQSVLSSTTETYLAGIRVREPTGVTFSTPSGMDEGLNDVLGFVSHSYDDTSATKYHEYETLETQTYELQLREGSHSIEDFIEEITRKLADEYPLTFRTHEDLRAQVLVEAYRNEVSFAKYSSKYLEPYSIMTLEYDSTISYRATEYAAGKRFDFIIFRIPEHGLRDFDVVLFSGLDLSTQGIPRDFFKYPRIIRLLRGTYGDYTPATVTYQRTFQPDSSLSLPILYNFDYWQRDKTATQQDYSSNYLAPAPANYVVVYTDGHIPTDTSMMSSSRDVLPRTGLQLVPIEFQLSLNSKAVFAQNTRDISGILGFADADSGEPTVLLIDRVFMQDDNASSRGFIGYDGPAPTGVTAPLYVILETRHRLRSGDTITIAGCDAVPSIDGTFTIEKLIGDIGFIVELDGVITDSKTGATPTRLRRLGRIGTVKPGAGTGTQLGSQVFSGIPDFNVLIDPAESDPDPDPYNIVWATNKVRLPQTLGDLTDCAITIHPATYAYTNGDPDMDKISPFTPDGYVVQDYPYTRREPVRRYRPLPTYLSQTRVYFLGNRTTPNGTSYDYTLYTDPPLEFSSHVPDPEVLVTRASDHRSVTFSSGGHSTWTDPYMKISVDDIFYIRAQNHGLFPSDSVSMYFAENTAPDSTITGTAYPYDNDTFVFRPLYYPGMNLMSDGPNVARVYKQTYFTANKENIYFSSAIHGFRPRVSNRSPYGDTEDFLTFYGDKYITLEINELGTFEGDYVPDANGVRRKFDPFAKIQMASEPGSILFNSLVESSKISDGRRIGKIDKFKISLRRPNGELYPLKREDFSFTLEISEERDYPKGTGESSSRGV